MLELSSEDTLRLNVLVNNVDAIRIDERALSVYGLSARGEAKVQLNPTGRPEQYLKAVREFLSTCALGSPGGYPVHLNRWTRMGQARDANLAKLLMLGEPEAITAVVCAPGLTEDLAQRAWWVDPSSENARRMLARESVAQAGLGKVLAEHLVEHLPFETEPRLIMDSVRLVLQPGLISDETRLRLWEKGASQHGYRIGFLEAQPDILPQPTTPRTDHAKLSNRLGMIAEKGNAPAALLLRTVGSAGQTFLAVCEQVLLHSSSQEAVVALLNALSHYFAAVRLEDEPCQDISVILRDAAQVVSQHAPACELLSVLPEMKRELAALYALARMDEAIVTPIFARSSASGSLMRRKIEPVVGPVLEQITVLRQTIQG
jgi:hypothetical protein